MSLLIAESPLQVLPTLATRIGLNEALLLQQINYWLNVSTNVRDGRKWVYNTHDKWLIQFPFWSKGTLRRVINSLKKSGVLVTGNYNQMGAMDRTIWYSINYEHECLQLCPVTSSNVQECSESQTDQPFAQNGQMQVLNMDKSICAERTNPFAQNEHSNNQEITQETTQESKRVRFQRPTLEQLEIFITDYVNKKNVFVEQNMAERFFDYYEANGWKVGKNAMKDWKATVRMWISRNHERGNPPGGNQVGFINHSGGNDHGQVYQQTKAQTRAALTDAVLDLGNTNW